MVFRQRLAEMGSNVSHIDNRRAVVAHLHWESPATLPIATKPAPQSSRQLGYTK
jgi:hypothetical protein